MKKKKKKKKKRLKKRMPSCNMKEAAIPEAGS